MIKYRSELHKIIDLKLTACELGTAEGYFAADILSWGVPKLYMVDSYECFPDKKGDISFPQSFHDNNFLAAIERVKPYGDKAVFLRGLTVPMSRVIEDNSLGLVYVDADHSYEAVKADIVAYWPKLRNGGIMSFHDFDNDAYGVTQAVMEFCLKKNINVNYLPEDKPDDAGAWIKKPL